MRKTLSCSILLTLALAASSAWALNPQTSYITDAVGECAGVDPTGATDSTAGINACITAHPIISLRAGTYKTSAPINVGLGGWVNGGGIIGAAMDQTIISNTSSTSDVVIVANHSSEVRLEQFTVTHTGTPVNSCGINYAVNGKVARSTLEHVRATNNFYGFCLGATDDSMAVFDVAEGNWSHGFAFQNSVADAGMQWEMDRTLSQLNDGAGYYIHAVANAGNTVVGNVWNMPIAFGNSSYGYAFVADTGAWIGGLNINDITASGNGSDNVYLNTNGGTNFQFSGGLIEYAGGASTGHNALTPASHVGNGINVTGSKMLDLTISDVNITNNSYHGVAVAVSSVSPYVTIHGANVSNNGQAAANTYAGVAMAAAGQLSLSGVLTKSATNVTQKWGVVQYAGTVQSFGGIYGDLTAGCAGTFKNGTAQLYNVGTGCP